MNSIDLRNVKQDEQSTADCIELSVVMPCLNEADTLAACIGKARKAMAENGIIGEVIVADNGSVDGSQQIGRNLGARVISVPERGYGNALMWGISAAEGQFVIMGDADDSYDFLEIPKFVEKLRLGHDLVQGCRLPRGNGTILPGAMPVLHRWVGNPFFSFLVRGMFRAPVHDVYCGLRGFTTKLYNELDLRCTGMEFATEMIIKSTLFGKDIVEVPITLHPDGRKSHKPHLRTFRDGWRTLRFFFLYSPRWLFWVPGSLLFFAGVVGYALALPGVTAFGATLDAHTLLFSSLFLVVGNLLIAFAVLAKTFAVTEGLMPQDKRLDAFHRVATLERGLLIGAILSVVGSLLLGETIAQWVRVNFGALDYGYTMRWAIPGVTACILGAQTIAVSLLGSVLRMGRRHKGPTSDNTG